MLLPGIFAVHRGSRSRRNCAQIGVDCVEVSTGHVAKIRPRHYRQEAVLRVKRIVTGSQGILELFQRQSSGLPVRVWRQIGGGDAAQIRRRAKIHASSQIGRAVNLSVPRNSKWGRKWIMSRRIGWARMAIVTTSYSVNDVAT